METGKHTAAEADDEHGLCADDRLAQQSQAMWASDRLGRLTSYAALATVVFTLGFLISFGWINRGLISDLYYAASEQRYMTMTGQVGPVTYLVYHDDLSTFRALEALALERDDIMGVEIYEYPSVSAIAFISEDADSIRDVQSLPGVSSIVRRQVPMLCALELESGSRLTG